jgi:signal transduction histidine kinase
MFISFENIGKLTQKYIGIDRLSIRLFLLIVRFLILAELLLLMPTLPRFHLSEMESQMRDLVFMTELRLLEEKGAHTDIAIPSGRGIILSSPDHEAIWFGQEDTIAAARNVPVRLWTDDFLTQLRLALDAATATSSAPMVYQISTEDLIHPGTHTDFKHYRTLNLIMPSNIITGAIQMFLIESLVLMLCLALLLGVPVTFFVERRIIRPLQRLVTDMTEFAKDPYKPQGGGIYTKDEEIISEAEQALDKLQRSTRNELLQRDKLASVGEAVTKINHDMRNVLSSAVLLSDSLEQSDDPRVKRSSTIVSKAIQRAVVLCGQMLTFIKTPDHLTPKTTDITTVINECALEIGISISYEGPDHLVVDSGYFFRLIHNLVNNAQKAGATEVTITTWKAGSYAVMDIADNGPGMTEKTIDLLFKPFAGSTHGSTGLGLCISRDIAIAHGGDLKLTRSNVNGSEFRLRLPAEVLGGVTPKKFWS